MTVPVRIALSTAVLVTAASVAACGKASTSREETPQTHAAAGRSAAEGFTGAPEDVRTLIGFYHTIRLSPDQERLKVEALSAMPAPCCSRYSLATCCCPCNMAKAAWGLAAWLIAEKGYGVDQVRQAETDWLKRVNPAGFSGNACFDGGCSRAMHDDGCGGMKEDAIAS